MGSSPHFDEAASGRSARTKAAAPDWSQRCAELFEELRRPARAMVARAYGKALSDEEIEDVYAAAWAATLSALRTRGAGLSDEELRAYVLTAVASHASKELRRRSRKPAGSLDEAREQSMADGHQPLPEEMVIGSEARGIARDLLTSLPARRRAVMLLRYGWGLSPAEVCALVAGLSPRAYRKEVSRGVEQLIERLKQVDSGEWCESREQLLRDYVAGTADDDVKRQVTEHLQHCRACASFTARLNGHLHDLGGAVALTVVAGSIGAQKLPLLDRASGMFQGARESAAGAIEKGESSLGTVAASGGARGSGAAGAGVVAKLAALGGTGKTALACVGASAAASACVAAGVVPGVSLNGSDPAPRQPEKERRAEARDPQPASSVAADGLAPSSQPITSEPVVDPGLVAPAAGDGGHEANKSDSEKPEVEPQAPPPVELEFDPVARVPTSSTPPPSSPPAQPAPAPSPSAGSSSSASAAGDEFGP